MDIIEEFLEKYKIDYVFDSTRDGTRFQFSNDPHTELYLKFKSIVFINRDYEEVIDLYGDCPPEEIIENLFIQYSELF